MQNITTFLSKSDIKPELTLVYVHEIDAIKYAVATDSFRLVQYKLPDLLQEHMAPGYYTAKAYKEICKAFNKKNHDIITLMDTINQQKAIQERYTGYVYPEYKQIIPNITELTDFDPEKSYMTEYFIDFISLIPSKAKSVTIPDFFSFDDIKQSTKTKAMYYHDDTISLLLMPRHN